MVWLTREEEEGRVSTGLWCAALLLLLLLLLPGAPWVCVCVCVCVLLLCLCGEHARSSTLLS